MRRYRLTTLFLVMLVTTPLLLSACGAKVGALPVDRSRLSAYVAMYTGATEAGTVQVSLQSGSPGAWQADNRVEVAGVSIVSTVQLNQDLRPLSSLFELDTANSQGGKVSATYTGEKVILDAETPNGPQKTERKLTGDYYDNEQIMATVAALKLEPKKRYTFTLIVSQSAIKLTPSMWLETDGKGNAVVEQVTTPAGTFDCTKVIFNAGISGSLDQTFWVNITEPHVVVKYHNGAYEYNLQELVIP